jgi:predicted GTPase
MSKPEEPNPLRYFAEALKQVEEILAYIPGDTLKALRERLGSLRGLILEHRPPTVALVGRRGAGKSSLLNALFGARVADLGHVKARTGRGRWFDYVGARGTLTILDTRGFQEGSAPEEPDVVDNAVPSVLVELKRKAPDVILFVVKASEVDAAQEGDLEGLERVASEVERHHGAKPPIVGVVTHCDLLEPKNVALHLAAGQDPEELEEKLAHVTEAERLLLEKLRSRGGIQGNIKGVLGVSSYLSFRADGTVRGDERWRIDDLCDRIFHTLPEAGRGIFARVARVQRLQEEMAQNLSRATAALCAALAVLSIPVADLVTITSLQVAMVIAIAWLAGRTLDAKAAAEFLGGLGVNVGAAFGLREVARALTKFVFPGAGAVVSGVVAFAGTMAIGAAARAYYLRGATLEEARKAYDDERKSGA